MKVWYIDSTLRDGEQAPGVSFHPAEKVNIASMLDELGIHEVEAGTPAMGKTEIATMKDIATAGFSFNTLSWCRATTDDIRAAVKTKTTGINISFPVSALQLESMNKNEKWILDCMPELIKMATDHFEIVAIGLQDASRANYNFLYNAINLANSFNASRIRIADTVGCLNPFTTQDLFTRLTSDFPSTTFEFHAHNDLGMATANSLAAVLSGANCLSTTINGIGERAGNTSLDEILFALKHSASIDPKLDTLKLKKISEYVSYVSGRPIPVSKPITGEKVFKHESGIHTNSLLKDKKSYQLICETETGLKSDSGIVFGKHSGTNALMDFFKTKGHYINKKNAISILQQIKLYSEIRKDNLPDHEIMELFYQLT
jgi:homocitrate synthase NifV